MLISLLDSFKPDIAHGFIICLAFELYFASQYLIAAGSSFSHIVDYARTIERSYIETYGGGVKRLCHQYHSIGLSSKGDDTSGRGQLHS